MKYNKNDEYNLHTYKPFALVSVGEVFLPVAPNDVTLPCVKCLPFSYGKQEDMNAREVFGGLPHKFDGETAVDVSEDACTFGGARVDRSVTLFIEEADGALPVAVSHDRLTEARMFSVFNLLTNAYDLHRILVQVQAEQLGTNIDPDLNDKITEVLDRAGFHYLVRGFEYLSGARLAVELEAVNLSGSSQKLKMRLPGFGRVEVLPDAIMLEHFLNNAAAVHGIETACQIATPSLVGGGVNIF